MAKVKACILEYLISTYSIPSPYPPPPAPGAPYYLNGNPDGGDVYLYWDMSNSRFATGTKIERKLESQPDSAFAEIGEVGGYEGEFQDSGIGPDAQTYRVRAYNASGYSAYS